MSLWDEIVKRHQSATEPPESPQEGASSDADLPIPQSDGTTAEFEAIGQQTVPTARISRGTRDRGFPVCTITDTVELRIQWNQDISNINPDAVTASVGTILYARVAGNVATRRFIDFSYVPPANGSGNVTFTIAAGAVMPSNAQQRFTFPYVTTGKSAAPIPTFGRAQNPVGTNLTEPFNNLTFYVDITWSQNVGTSFHLDTDPSDSILDSDVRILVSPAPSTTGLSTDIRATLGTLTNVGTPGTTTHFRQQILVEIVTATNSLTNLVLFVVLDGVQISAPQHLVSPEAGRIFQWQNTTPIVEWITNANVTRVATFQVQGRWSQAVTGFDVSDISVSAGTIVAGSFSYTSSDRRFSFRLTPPTMGNGELTVTIPANRVSPANALPQTWTTYYGFPVATITSEFVRVVNHFSRLEVTVDWSGPVSGFCQSDVTVSVGSIAGIFGVDRDDPRRYRFDVDLPANRSGTLTITIPANSVTPANALATYSVAYNTIKETLTPTISGLWLTADDREEASERVTGRADGNYFGVHVDWGKEVGQVICNGDFTVTTNIAGVTQDDLQVSRNGGDDQYVMFTLDTSSLTAPTNGTLTFTVNAGAVPDGLNFFPSQRASQTFQIRALLPGPDFSYDAFWFDGYDWYWEFSSQLNIRTPVIADFTLGSAQHITPQRTEYPGAAVYGTPTITNISTGGASTHWRMSGTIPVEYRTFELSLWPGILARKISVTPADANRALNNRLFTEGTGFEPYRPLRADGGTRDRGYLPVLGTALDSTGSALASNMDGDSASQRIAGLSSFQVPITWSSCATAQAVDDFGEEDVRVTTTITGASVSVMSLCRVGTTSVWRATINVERGTASATAQGRINVEVRGNALPTDNIETRDASRSANRDYYYDATNLPIPTEAGYTPTLGRALDDDGTGLPMNADGDTGQPIASQTDFIVPITWPSGDATTEAVAQFTAMDITGSSNIAGVSANVRSLTRVGTTSVWRALIRAIGATTNSTGTVTVMVNQGALPSTSGRDQSQAASRDYAFNAQGPAPIATINPGGLSSGSLGFSIQWNVVVAGFDVSEVTLSSSGNTFTFSNASMNSGDNQRFNYTADVSGFGQSTITATIDAGAIAGSVTTLPSAETSGEVGTFTQRDEGFTPTFNARARAADGSALPANADGESNTQRIKRRTQFIVPISWTDSVAQTAAENQFCPNDITVTTGLTNVSATVTSLTRQGTTAVWHALVTVSRTDIGGGTGSFLVNVRAGALTQSNTHEASQSAEQRYYAQIQRAAATPTISNPRLTDAGSTVTTITGAGFWVDVDWDKNDPAITTSSFGASELTWSAPSGLTVTTSQLVRRSTTRHDQWKAEMSVTGTGQGNIAGTISAGAIPVSDAVEASLSGSNTFAINVAIPSPTITIGDAENPVGTTLATINQNFYVDLDWNEDVGSQFTDADISLARTSGDTSVSASLGSISNVGTIGTNQNYRVFVTVTGNGMAVFTLTVRANAIPSTSTRSASVETTKQFSFERVIGGLTPTIGDWRRTATGATQTGTITRTLTFYAWIDWPEPVTEFGIADATVAPASTLAGVSARVALANRISGMPAPVANQNYLAEIVLSSTRTSTCTGNVTLTIAAGAIPAGGGRAASLQASKVFSVTIQEPAASITIGAGTVTGGRVSFPVTFSKNIPLADFTASDVQITTSNTMVQVTDITVVRTTSGGNTTGWTASGEIRGTGTTTFTCQVSAGAIPETDARFATAQASATSASFSVAGAPIPVAEAAWVKLTPLLNRIETTTQEDTFEIEFSEDVVLEDGTDLTAAADTWKEWLKFEGVPLPDTAFEVVAMDDILTIEALNAPCSERRFALGATYRLRIAFRPSLNFTPLTSAFIGTGVTVTSVTEVGVGKLYELLLTFPSTASGSRTSRLQARASAFDGIRSNQTLMTCLYGGDNLRASRFPTTRREQNSCFTFYIHAEPSVTATPQSSAILVTNGSVISLEEIDVGRQYRCVIQVAASGSGQVVVTARHQGWTNISANQELGRVAYGA